MELEAKGEYLDKTVRSSGSQDHHAVAPDRRGLALGPNPFPGSGLEPTAAPYNRCQSSCLPTSHEGDLSRFSAAPSSMGRRLCQVIKAADDWKSFPGLTVLAVPWPVISGIQASLSTRLWPALCPTRVPLSLWPGSALCSQVALGPSQRGSGSAGLRICSCTAWRWCSASPAPPPSRSGGLSGEVRCQHSTWPEQQSLKVTG